MKIYTKKGDTGTTGLLGGTRVAKHDHRIDTYGTLDELNAHLGMLRDYDEVDEFQQIIIEIQENLFTLGSQLAADPYHNKFELPNISDNAVGRLEVQIDLMDEKLPELKNFILPGGHKAISQCHICRTVCRRAERMASALSEASKVDPMVIQYLNRLSDYLFTLARMLGQKTGAEETPWTPR